jgi:transcription antitermination factor NusG
MIETQQTSWYALHVRLRQECLVEEALRYKGYETFLPLHRANAREYERHNNIQLPLFPGYLFCRCDMGSNSGGKIVTTPGVMRILGSKFPTPVPDDEIEAVKRLVRSKAVLSPCPFMQPGQIVMIRGGPLRGLKGCVVAEHSCFRLVISLTLLRRSVAVTIERDWVSPVLA